MEIQQREVQDSDDIRWVCVQALAGVAGAAAAEASERLESDAGTVPVVCTPSGGAQSVRLALPVGWADRVSDAELLRAIVEAQDP